MTHKEVLTVGNPVALGFGAMRLPDADQTAQMVDAYLQAGYNYFDTAWIYGDSEEKLNKTLVSRHARDSFLLADKLPPWEVKNTRDCERIFDTQLKRLGVDYIDFYLVHSLDDGGEEAVEAKDLFGFVKKKKDAGYIKHMGFSFHGTSAYLERLLQRHPEVEFIMLQLNYADILAGPAGEWQALARKYNKPFIVMEPVKGGGLAKLPAPAEALLKAHAPNRSIASWAIQYAATLEGATVMLSGMSNMAQLQDNLKTFKDLKPLTPDEHNLLSQVMGEISKVAAIPCTACKYCHAHCPENIDIASCFGLYNGVKMGDAHWNRANMYRTLAKRAEHCIECGACQPYCPQKVDIIAGLKEVASAF
ncbi:MAG: aldo/keto reductase [Defluviitaleaceae bacterium]|nr:aldo/keto reductase [Defluviitaleaceae bacterium]